MPSARPPFRTSGATHPLAPLLVLASALAATALAGCGGGGGDARPQQAKPVPVVTAAVERRAVPIRLQAVGNAEPIASVSVVSRVDGEITRVLVRDGQEVRKGEVLFEIDPAPYQIALRSAKAALARDLAQLRNAEDREQHGRALFAQHFIARDDLTQLETNRASAAATVDADRAAVDQAALNLSYTTIRAPVAGKIGHVALQPGNVVRAASPVPLTTLNVLSPIDIAFSVPEENAGAVRRALAAGKVEVHAHPDDAGSVSQDEVGELAFVDNAIDTATGTIRLRARFANPQRVLWPGQFVVVNFAIGLDRAAIVVPSSAILNGPSGTFVFVISKDAVAAQRSVTVERTAGPDAVVTGVEPGERVVTDGQSRLVPGSHVVESGASAPAGKPATR